MRGGRVGAEGATAVNIDGFPVSQSEFEFFFNRNLDRLKQSFKDQELPDFARKMAQSTTLNQLVAREVTLIQADELGIIAPDVEVAGLIRTSMADERGDFDPIAYRHQFLPYFKGRFGMDYESLVRQDIRANLLESLLASVDEKTPDAGNSPEGVTWTFESVTLDPNALVSAGLIKSVEEANGIAEEIAKQDPKNWKKKLGALKIESKKSGPITIAQRKTLLDGQGAFEDYEEIFKLTKENSGLNKVVKRGGKLYVVRLLDKFSKPGENAKDANDPGSFYRAWISRLIAKAKVQSFLEKE